LSFINGSNGKINGTVELLGYGDKSDPNDTSKGNTITLQGEGNIFKTGHGNDKFIVVNGVGDDLGGKNQIKQFTSLDGGQGNNQITFIDGANFTINKNDTIKNIQYFGLNNASKVTFKNINTDDGLNSGIDTYDIVDSSSTLTYQWTNSNTHFDRLLKGEGSFVIDLLSPNRMVSSLNEFAFDNSTNLGNFSGAIDLSNLQYTLFDSAEHLNTTALTKATLKASSNSYITVGAGDQSIKGLTISGGIINFGHIDLSDDKSTNHVSVNNLVLDKGHIEIDVTGSIYNPNIPSSLPLLEQDSDIIFTQLVSADHVSGGAINIDIDRLLKGEGSFVIDLLSPNRMVSSLNEFAFDNSTNLGNFSGAINTINR